MALVYKIDTLGFKGVEFTQSSEDLLNWPEAVKFAASHNAVLQSVREAAAFRTQAKNKDYAEYYQATRTVAIYFNDGPTNFYVAFDDVPKAQKNIILARAVDGYNANKEGREFILSKKDELIAQLLERAEKSDRIVQVVESPLKLATEASAGSSKFGSNKIVKALLGEVAEPYAKWLHEHGHNIELVYLLDPKSLDGVADDNVLVRAVSLGDRFFYSIYADKRFYDFDSGFDFSGRARGVRNAPEWPDVPENERTYRLEFKQDGTFSVLGRKLAAQVNSPLSSSSAFSFDNPCGD